MPNFVARSNVVLLMDVARELAGELKVTLVEAADMVSESVTDNMPLMRLPVSGGLPWEFDDNRRDLLHSFWNSQWWDEELLARVEKATGGTTVDLERAMQLAVMKSDAQRLKADITEHYARLTSGPANYAEFIETGYVSESVKKRRLVFFDDLIGLISAARLIAKTRNVSLAEASDFLDRLLVDDGTVIYTKISGDTVVELGEAWYAPACDYVCEALHNNWWSRPELLDQRIGRRGVLRDELAISNIDAVRLLDIAWSGYQGGQASAENSGAVEISGQTFARLQRAIAAFPVCYPDYKTEPLKMDLDIRPWLKTTRLANSDREAHVFGTILAEHFKLLAGTQKTQ